MVSVSNAHINVHCVCIDNVTGIALTGFTIDAVQQRQHIRRSQQHYPQSHHKFNPVV